MRQPLVLIDFPAMGFGQTTAQVRLRKLRFKTERKMSDTAKSRTTVRRQGNHGNVFMLPKRSANNNASNKRAPAHDCEWRVPNNAGRRFDRCSAGEPVGNWDLPNCGKVFRTLGSVPEAAVFYASACRTTRGICTGHARWPHGSDERFA